MKKIIVILMIIIFAGIIFSVYFFNPRVVIERKFNIQLPKDARIINYTNGYNLCGAKILISEEDVQDFKNSVGYDPRPYDHPSNFKNILDWWDMDINDITTYYHQFFKPMFVKTGEIDMFIVNNNNLYYLYLCYVF